MRVVVTIPRVRRRYAAQGRPTVRAGNALRCAALLCVVWPAATAGLGAEADVVPPGRGLVSLIDDVLVPAHRAGVVTSIEVREGDQLAPGAPLAQIDVEQAELEAAAARAERETAAAKAGSDIDVRYAKATHGVAQAEHLSGIDANRRAPNAVSQIELERMRLAADQAFLKIEASAHEQNVRALETRAFAARENLAQLNVRQRLLKSPIEGLVAELFVRPGEWIEPSKPLLRIVGLARLRVETFVPVARRSPKELLGRTAEVRVPLVGGAAETFSGKVVFVSPLVQPGGDYRVWIEVANRRDGDHWLLRPGLEAEVRIAAP